MFLKKKQTTTLETVAAVPTQSEMNGRDKNLVVHSSLATEKLKPVAKKFKNNVVLPKCLV